MQMRMKLMRSFVWSESTRDELGLLPPPCGEGRCTQASLRSLRKLGCAAPGWGWCGEMMLAPPAKESHYPHPQPHPPRGRGAQYIVWKESITPL